VYPQVDDRCLRVLGGVGERLGRGVISGRLDLLPRRRAQIQVELDRHRRAPGERLERRAQPGLGQHGGMNAVRDLPQLVQGGKQTISQQRQLTPDPSAGRGVIF
jgi:hypothetical protein